ncbi:MAG: DUF4439 domain-containing protein, partial [Frankiaceae bacterium]|nr:DUF4439 domain-containing protein [Frankiaceae bacterium]
MSDLAALQNALAAEHAAVYGYGAAGAVMRGSDRDYASRSLETHMRQRDQLITMIGDVNASPVPAQPAYRLPSPLTSHSAARDLAAHLEQGVAGALWDLVAATAPNSHARA